ncbi:MAG: hypothetical protein IAG10_07250 [Planctomycetaceae bacterium]|nr:hypothetical protein [Planctomycetaceae bacterium]
MIRLGLLMACVGLLNGGCSKPEAAKSPKLAESPESRLPPVQADEAVRRVLRGLEQRQARALWEFLPPSYRRDVQQLARDVAERLDEKSWGPFVATWEKARQVLPKKLSSPTPSKSGDKERGPGTSLPFDPKALAQFLNAIGDSELSDLKRLRTIELDRFLDQTGDNLLATLGLIAVGDSNGSANDPFSQFGKVQVELTSSAGGTGVVKIRWPEQEPTMHEFVRVEDQWIPQSLAEAWPAQFPEVRERSLAWADGVREHPDEWHARLREIDEWLDGLSVTKSDADARQVWQSGVSRLVVAWFGTVSPSEVPQGSESNPPKPARVKRPDTEVLLPDEPGK